MPQIVMISSSINPKPASKTSCGPSSKAGGFKERRTYGVIMHGYDFNDEEICGGMFETLVNLRKCCIKWVYPLFHKMLGDGGA